MTLKPARMSFSISLTLAMIIGSAIGQQPIVVQSQEQQAILDPSVSDSGSRHFGIVVCTDLIS